MRKKNWSPNKPHFKKKDTPENQTLAFNFAIKYLSFRNRSTKEVNDYLVKKNFDPETINVTLKNLIDKKFINDEEFTNQWIESRQKYKNKSKLVLKQELKLKGVSSGMIDHTLSNAEDDIEVAKRLFEKKKKTLGNLPPEEFKKKMGGFLQRRGFSYDVISKLIKSRPEA
ncbi:MAG TPA: regulatory protein RecX [Patescibacteria group bacterium]|nr:regulatory protein RecX [Patescibacteria group bacterium]